MSIANYTDLQSAVADYLARSDLAVRIPDFITLAEDRIARKMRVRDMEASATVTLTNGSGPVPTDYLEWVTATWNGARPVDLRYFEPDSEEWRIRYRPNGDPTMFSILAGQLMIRPVVAGNVTLVYYQKIPALAAANTNWLLTKYPAIYVNYSLAEAYMFLKDENRGAAFLSLGDNGINDALDDSDSNKLARRPSREAETQDIDRSKAVNP